MDLFDLHCDTAFECVKLGGVDLSCGARHISLERGGYLGKWRQVFAIFMPDEADDGSPLRGESAVRHYERVRDYIRRQASKLEGFEVADSAEKFESEICGCQAVMSVEGGSALAGDISRVQSLYDDGVRLMGLTWNGANELADGVRVENAGGLKPFGFEVLDEMRRLKMAVDVSHLSDAGFYDVAEFLGRTRTPFVASHSNARDICGNMRNLTADMIRTIARAGGLIGLNFYRDFLRDDGSAEMSDIICHAEYMLGLGCEQCLCLGSDFDGCEIAADMVGIESMGELYEMLLRVNYSESLVRRIFFGNADRFFRENVFL